MVKTPKAVYLLFYFIISLFFLETMLRISTTGIFFSSGLVYTLIFSMSIAIFFYFICSLFESKISYVLSIILLGLSVLIFSSQLIYYKFFRTFYTLYSVGNGAQVFEFRKDILNHIIKSSIWIILFLLPIVIILAFGKKILSFEKTNWHYKVLLICCFIFSYLVSFAAVCIGSREQYSAYDLYFNNSNITFSVNKLGLITTMRLDLQRLTFGWSPSLEVSIPVSPDSSPDITGNADLDKRAQYIFRNTNKEKVVEYNTMNIGFTQLISDEKNQVIKDMHKYFERILPTEKNNYTGKYKGYNLILITAESFSPYAVREDVTPTLYKMVHQGYNFTNFYNPIWGVSTSDGEYVACTSLIPKSGVWSFLKSGSNYLPFTMGNMLKKLNYKTTAYHDHTYNYYRRDISHPNMGYEYKALGKGLDIKKTWPESDLEMIDKTVSEYINNQPFHTYYMTVSGHMQYSFSGNSMASKNKQYVQNLPYSEAGKAYIAAQIELDKAMESLLNQLEKAGISDKTLIALNADHYPYGLEDSVIDELAGHTVEKNFELYKSTFILYTKGMEPITIDKPCSSLDIIPTLSNLLGLEYDSRLLMGKDIFSSSEPLVTFSNKSFITDKGRYNSVTGVFVPVEGVPVDETYRKKVSSIIDGKFYYSVKILENDYYKKVLK